SELDTPRIWTWVKLPPPSIEAAPGVMLSTSVMLSRPRSRMSSPVTAAIAMGTSSWRSSRLRAVTVTVPSVVAAPWSWSSAAARGSCASAGPESRAPRTAVARAVRVKRPSRMVGVGLRDMSGSGSTWERARGHPQAGPESRRTTDAKVKWRSAGAPGGASVRQVQLDPQGPRPQARGLAAQVAGVDRAPVVEQVLAVQGQLPAGGRGHAQARGDAGDGVALVAFDQSGQARRVVAGVERGQPLQPVAQGTAMDGGGEQRGARNVVHR